MRGIVAILLLLVFAATPTFAADTFIGVPLDVPGGTKLDAESETTGSGDVKRQRMRSYVYDNAGSTVTLDVLDEVAPVKMAGLASVVFRIASGGNGVMTIKPVICALATCSASDYVADQAVFVDGNGERSLALALTDPNDPYTLTVLTAAAPTHVGIKVTAYTSGSISVTPIGVYAKNVQPVAVKLGDGLAVMEADDPGDGKPEVRVGAPRAVGTVPISRTATTPSPCTIDATDETCAINGSGAGIVSVEVPSGATMTAVFEARFGTNAWVATPFFFETGAPNSFPIRGHFLRNGFTEYRVRGTSVSAGSTTVHMEVSPGGNLAPASVNCYTAATASTNATSCKTTAGYLTHLSLTNATATLYYLRLYNLAAAPTCSSATGYVKSVPIPASTTGGGREISYEANPALFTTGIAWCVTGGASSTDNTNAAVGVFVDAQVR